MSATQPTPLWTGFLDSTGTPCLKVAIGGPVRGVQQEFEAVIDTRFTGFVCIPILQAFPPGLVLYGTTETAYADGSRSAKLTAKGEVTVSGESRAGIIILESSSDSLLLGREFLRTFGRALTVHPNTGFVCLADEATLTRWLGTPNQPSARGS